ncbi:HAD family hydrolase [Candidatus Hydrogenedentota bacterium]
MADLYELCSRNITRCWSPRDHDAESYGDLLGQIRATSFQASLRKKRLIAIFEANRIVPISEELSRDIIIWCVENPGGTENEVEHIRGLVKEIVKDPAQQIEWRKKKRSLSKASRELRRALLRFCIDAKDVSKIVLLEKDTYRLLHENKEHLEANGILGQLKGLVKKKSRKRDMKIESAEEFGIVRPLPKLRTKNTLVFCDFDRSLAFTSLEGATIRNTKLVPGERRAVHKETTRISKKLSEYIVLMTGRRPVNYHKMTSLLFHKVAFVEHGAILTCPENRWNQNDPTWMKCHEKALSGKHGSNDLLNCMSFLEKKYDVRIDNEGRLASFRISLEDNKEEGGGKRKALTQEDLREIAADTRVHRSVYGIKPIENQGSLDFIPETAGKANAVRYICETRGVLPEDCIAIGDDASDLGMLLAVGFPFTYGTSLMYEDGFLTPNVEELRTKLEDNPNFRLLQGHGHHIAIDFMKCVEAMLAAASENI